MFSRKWFFSFSRFSGKWGFSRNSTPQSALKQLNPSIFQCKKNLADSPEGLKKDEIPSTLSKYELFSEETSHETLDVEEERQKIIPDNRIRDAFEGINLQRGVAGIFDVEEIVSLLRKEKGEEIVVIKIPSEYRYADYVVIVSGRSSRHMLAVSDFIRRIYKRKVGGSVCIPGLEGRNSKMWMALDLGNIILHVFSKSARQLYDLETLWSMGKDFDTVTQKKKASSIELMTDYSKILARFTPNS